MVLPAVYLKAAFLIYVASVRVRDFFEMKNIKTDMSPLEKYFTHNFCLHTLRINRNLFNADLKGHQDSTLC